MLDKKNNFWSFFSSVKLTIALLLVIIFSSILGTLIPQQEAADTVVQRLSPGMITIAQKLQLFDIYHSIWFIIFMILLAVNLIVCSANRWPVSLKRFRGILSPDNEMIFRDPPPDQAVISMRAVNEEAARVEGILKKGYRGVRRKETERGIFITGEKGNASHLGVYIIHASILIILAGTMIGYIWGFDAYMEIPEGESTDTVTLKRGGDFKKLDFTIQCDRFSMGYYEDGTPKLYQSELSFIKNGSTLQQSAVLVNHPATFEGIRFYQSSYGLLPSGDALLVVRKGQNQKRTINVAAGSEFDLLGKDGNAKILRMEENFMRMGPAVKIQITSATQNVQFWVFQNIEEIEAANPGLRQRVPIFNPGLFAPYVFSLATIQPKHYTGLQVNYDPGLPIVIGGSCFLIAGFIVVFFYAHRQVWVGITSQGEKTCVSIFGKTNKDSVGLTREISRLIKEIEKTGASSA
ncbi:MAG: cytochrome c biogenesis protein ResB [Syntrophaceae bacterium]